MILHPAIADLLLAQSKIPYLSGKQIICDEQKSYVNTEFFIDHTEIDKALAEENKKSYTWQLGDKLSPGFEFLAFTPLTEYLLDWKLDRHHENLNTSLVKAKTIEVYELQQDSNPQQPTFVYAPKVVVSDEYADLGRKLHVGKTIKLSDLLSTHGQFRQSESSADNSAAPESSKTYKP